MQPRLPQHPQRCRGHFSPRSYRADSQFASYVYLEGTEIDFSDDLLNGGFKFGNPQANRTCGCGTSFSV